MKFSHKRCRILFLLPFSVWITWGQTILKSDLSYFSNFRFSRADTLRGMLRPERTCFDVTFYDLKLRFDIPNKSIAGSNDISFLVTEPTQRLQIDLFENMAVDSILYVDEEGTSFRCRYLRDGNAIFVDLPRTLTPGNQIHRLRVVYHGKPHEARRPPWDGGFVWRKDPEGNPWIAVACEGIGASLWWPLKDHLSDEPDSMRIVLTVPRPLLAIANGELYSIEYDETQQWVTYEWFVLYPINSYNVTFYIGDYHHFQDHYPDPQVGKLQLDFYVLRKNAQKALEFLPKETRRTLKAFHHYLGPYPFWVDGYALAEAPYWGMEHQSAIAYGNQFHLNEWGFDYIIVHESAHEWFGNHISAVDLADLWIHESFATYAEALFIEYYHGYDSALAYLQSQKGLIRNRYPIIGPRGVNFENFGDNDMYFKGAWFLNTLRSCINDDAKWFAWFHALYSDFGMKTIPSDSILVHFNRFFQVDYTPIFRQYLCHPYPPRVEVKMKKRKQEKTSGVLLQFRFKTEETPFEMPLEWVNGKNGKVYRTTGSNEWQTLFIPEATVDDVRLHTKRFYVLMELN